MKGWPHPGAARTEAPERPPEHVAETQGRGPLEVRGRVQQVLMLLMLRPLLLPLVPGWAQCGFQFASFAS